MGGFSNEREREKSAFDSMASDAKKLRAFPKLVEALEPFAALAEAVANAGHLSGHAEELYCIGQIEGPPICVTRTAVSDARAALALAREASE